MIVRQTGLKKQVTMEHYTVRMVPLEFGQKVFLKAGLLLTINLTSILSKVTVL